MPTFKYSARMPSQVSVFGMHDAADRRELQSYLAARNLELVDAQEMSVHPDLAKEFPELPRLVQLRIGERLREAILNGLPTHEAIRAVAAEPFEHPMMMLMPWLLVLAFFVSAVMTVLAVMSDGARWIASITAIAAPLVVLCVWPMVGMWVVERPRRALRTLADQMERGHMPRLLIFQRMSGEMGAVARSELADDAKARSLADLVPTATTSNLRSHQFAARLIGPLLILSLMVWGIQIVCLTVIPQFRTIFSGFGLQLPMMTEAIFFVSGMIEFLGMPGLLISIGFLGGLLCLLYVFLASSRWNELIGLVPWLGYSARWLLQARLARMLSVLLRNQADPALALEVAAQTSSSKSIRKEGERLAAMVREGLPEQTSSKLLSGLPVSLLFQVSESDRKEQTQLEASQSFSLYADALEHAAAGSGSFFAVLVEVFVILTVGVLLGFLTLGIFLPLARLMNDLS